LSVREAYGFLENLERTQVIRTVRQKPSQHREKRKLSKRFAGALHLCDKAHPKSHTKNFWGVLFYVKIHIRE